MTEIFNYFFAKIGNSNSLLNYSIDKANQETNLEKKSHLWFGFTSYDNNSIPVLAANNSNPQDRPAPSDLYYLTLVSGVPIERAKTRIITYSSDKLQIWKIEGSIRSMEKAEFEEFFEHHKNNPKTLSAYKDKNAPPLDVQLKAKYLPVTLEGEFRRDLLPACIDSLSVFRSLNQRTFKIMNVINNGYVPEHILCEFLKGEKLFSSTMLSENPFESKFGCFVRKYFDWLRDTRKTKSFSDTYNLSIKQTFELATSIMSPAQLETAASLFAQDLGLTLDVAIGKGLDVIDVRATIRHKRRQKEYTKLLGAINEKLSSIIGNLDSGIRSSLMERGTLSIQCKNFDANIGGEDILLFKPTGKLDGRTVTLEAIQKYIAKDESHLINFRQWIDLVMFNYLEDKITLGI